ncbi:MAG: DUF177 domain-containing protein [Ekhidna sp.]
MKQLRAYKIDIFGLSNNPHSFEFSFDEAFFAEFEDSLVSKGKGSCHVDLMKSDSMITLNLSINGTIELECDRSLELFNHQISVKSEVIFKYGDEENELSEDVFVILKDQQEINIGEFLYEFIMLEVPMKKLHPKFQNDDDDDESDILIYADKSNEEEKGIDPRWEALKNLRKDK